MYLKNASWAKPFALLAVMAMVGACGLPRVGPTKEEIFDGSTQRQGDAFIVPVDRRVATATAVYPALGFTPHS